MNRRSFFAGVFGAFALVSSSVFASELKDSLKHLAERHNAPAFELPDASGNKISSKDFAGKVLVVNFWATWCPPCRKEMPSMQRLWHSLRKEGVELIAIDFGDPPEPVQEFAREENIEFPLLLDPTGDVVRAFGVVGLPTTFVIDRQGRVALKAIGERDWDAEHIVTTIRKLARE
jgi:peroxiredoxin